MSVLFVLRVSMLSFRSLFFLNARFLASIRALFNAYDNVERRIEGC